MKLIYASILALAFMAAPGFAKDFSGSFGRDTSCQPSNGNWANDWHITCPMQGSGSGGVKAIKEEKPEPIPCPYPEYEHEVAA